MTIGEYTYGKPKVKTFGNDGELTIGKFCSIAEDVTILLGGEHEYQNVSQFPFFAYMKEAKDFETGHTKGDVVIGNDVWIGYGATILSGVKIGDGAVVGTGSVVTKDIPPYEIWAGNPAKMIGWRKNPYIAWWNWPKEKIVEALPLLTSPNIDDFRKNYDH